MADIHPQSSQIQDDNNVFITECLDLYILCDHSSRDSNKFVNSAKFCALLMGGNFYFDKELREQTSCLLVSHI